MLESVSGPSFVQLKDHIDLRGDEEKLFELLLQVIKCSNLRTQLRVAGGWVRDKLLGMDCNDIDIAVDNMSGQDFCEEVNKYLSESGEETRVYHVIQRNPVKSKHLETAKMNFFNYIWVDFVNLREEDYCKNSRIPTMRFATAEQDAYRRDLTINSLFYNIHSSLVEDFTGRGIADLKYGIIATPLPPKQTFLEDPLRVLRAIRFGARLGFMLDEELKRAAADEDVRAAIADKISRERIGHEIELMMSSNRPVQAMTHIVDLKLFWTVFSLPSDFEPSNLEGCERQCVAYLSSAWGLLNLIGRSSFADDQIRLCLYAAFCLPFRETVYRRNKVKKNPVVYYILLNSLKLESGGTKKVVSLHAATKKFATLIPSLVSKEDIQVLEVNRKRDNEVSFASEPRVMAGLLLREIEEYWRVALLLSMLLHPSDIVSSTSFTNDEHVELDRRSRLFRTTENAVRALGLEKVWEMKPLIDGNVLMCSLQLKSRGPVVGKLKQNVLEWQLAHPSGTVVECFEWMNQNSLKRCREMDG